MYPDWVEKYHITGTSVKKIGDNYYLYKVSSKRVKDKKYPVTTQTYLGKITETGVTKTFPLRFIPGETVIMPLNIALNIQNIENILNSVYGVIEQGYFYPSNINDEQIELLINNYNMIDLRIKL